MNQKKEFGRDPERLEAQIDVTRSKISEDLRAIGDRLTPENVKHELKEEAKHMVENAKHAAAGKLREKKDAAVESMSETMSDVGYRARRAGDKTVHYARDNAVPLALIGVGLGWLLASRRRAEREAWRTRGAGQYGEDYVEYGDEDIEYIEGAEEEPGRLRQRVDETKHRVEQRVGEVKGEAEQRYRRVKGRAEEKLHRGAERARELRHSAEHKVRDARERSREYAHESPLAVGAVAMAAGIGVGLLLPATHKEQELIGPTRDRLAREAKDTAQQLKSTVQDTARELKTQVREQVTH